MPYVVQIEPDRRIRLLSILCGLLLHTVGIAMLLGLPFSLLPKLLLVALWIAYGLKERQRQRRGFRRVGKIRIHEDGALECVDPTGASEPVRLLGGSVVLPRLAWLRLQFRDGSDYGELLSGDAARHSDWHGLQLIWAQCGVRFGRLD